MLPLTQRLYDHPRTSLQLKAVIEKLADWDRFTAMSREELALSIGILSGELMNAFKELDAYAASARLH